MNRTGGYVLVTCLYVLAMLSVSSLLLVRTATLMAGDVRLLDNQAQILNDAQEQLASMSEQGLTALGTSCSSQSAPQFAARVLHRRSVTGFDAEGEVVNAFYSVYGLQACMDGRALIETTLGVFDPPDAFAGSAVPSDVAIGRLSWRQVW